MARFWSPFLVDFNRGADVACNNVGLHRMGPRSQDVTLGPLGGVGSYQNTLKMRGIAICLDLRC